MGKIERGDGRRRQLKLAKNFHAPHNDGTEAKALGSELDSFRRRDADTTLCCPFMCHEKLHNLTPNCIGKANVGQT